MNKFKISTVLLSTILSVISFNSFAADANNNFTSSATLNAACEIQANSLNFGEIEPSPTGEATLKGSLSLKCSSTTNYVVKFNVGSGASYADRSMGGTGGNTDRLHYNLYVDSNHTEIWGDETVGTVSGLADGEEHYYSIYAKLPLNQYVRPDIYVDDIVAELTY